ncbi:M66 family metalloprotease [Candidatus Palauibacter scopulicola]|uniref:leucine-rich repeat domain-containing protein n=1 Tax=Candidatus Palauibacter scopulicola TaxID=3056741 RepID=UPI00287350A8|nr:M66 family metalloprotease [Candidatus Palauibacter scopulicola]
MASLVVLSAVACGGEEPVAPPPPPPPAPVPTTITVVPASATLYSIGVETGLHATVRDQNDQVVHRQTISWSSGDPSVATVDDQGRVTSTGEGSVEITAALAGVEGGPQGTAEIVVDMTMTRTLVALHAETGGTDWINAENWLTGRPLRTWYGVETDLVGRVTRLNLAENGLKGLIPPALKDLERLERLDLSGNALSGPIPPELGTLWSLRALDLHGNTLNGSIPSELGGLDSLQTLDLQQNALGGSIPAEVGGLGSLQSLELQENELRGSIPSELGNLHGLQSLHVQENELTGRIPPKLGDLESLESLDLHDNPLSGPIPLQFIDLSLARFNWSSTDLCAPPDPVFQAWLRSIAEHSRGAAGGSGTGNCRGSPVLAVHGAHLTQAAQNFEGDVPLIAGRPALLRVFVTADSANTYRPRAWAAFEVDGSEAHRVEMEFPSGGLPELVDSEKPDRSFRAVVPGDVLRPGVRMVVQIDPDSVVPRAAGRLDRLPERGDLRLDVRPMPSLHLTIVPVLFGPAPDSSALEWASALEPDDPSIEFVTNILPVGDLGLEVAPTFHTSTEIRPVWTGAGYEGMAEILQEIRLVQTSAGALDEYWYAVVAADRGGIGLIGARTSLGVSNAATMAHELGHNMGLAHAPCGDPRGVDRRYPYEGGNIGVPGYDFRSDEFVASSTPDLMTYCGPQWISDYHFDKALEHRFENDAAPGRDAAVTGDIRGAQLLLWGRVSPGGRLKLDPAFVLDASPRLPASGGPYRVEGSGANGESLFRLNFDLERVDHGGGSFLFAIPFDDRWTHSLDRIVLSGPEGAAVLDGGSDAPMALVTDRATGRIRAILRGEDAVRDAVTSLGTAVGSTYATDILVSRGLPGSARRKAPTP